MKTALVGKIVLGLLALAAAGGVARGASYDQCIYALNPSGAGTLAMSGSVNISAPNCGVVVDSASSSALAISGSAKLTAKYIDIVGGYARSGSATLSPTPQTGSASQPDPLTFLVPPIAGACDYTNVRVTGSGSTTLNPGTYCNGISISGSSQVNFNSGTYVLLGGGLNISGSGQLNGAAVTFFLTQNSTYTYGPLSVSGSVELNLSAPTSISSSYYGILFYQDPSIGSGKAASTISGSASSTMSGVFYFPTTGVSYSGSSSAGNYLIIDAENVTFTGSVTINSNYPNSRSPLEPPVAISISAPTSVVYPGQTLQFTAVVNNSTQGVVWTISPSTPGGVSSTGLYTAPSSITTQQSVTVTASSVEDPTKSASIVITLSPAISVVVSPATPTVYGGKTQQFSAQVLNTSNQSVTWTLNPSTGAGTINSTTGLYTAPTTVTTLESVIVTATSQQDTTKSATAALTLSPPVALTVSPATVSLYAGQTQTFSATVINATNTAVNWTLNLGASGGINPTSGVYTTPADIPTQTSVTVTATSQADTTKTATATITLLPLTIGVTPSTTTVFVGQTQQFTASVAQATNTAVNWSASVGIITSAGLYTAPPTVSTQQSVTITATSQSDSTKSATATVTVPVVSLTVAPATATLYAGQTQSYSATVINAASTAVIWQVSPATGAGTIDSMGNYTAPPVVASLQTVTIKATSQADSTKSATATLTLQPVAVSVAPTAASLSAGQTQQFTATVTYSSNSGVTWAASAGTIDSTGLYTAPSTVMSQQTVTVTATSQADTTKLATATVTLLPSVTISITPQTVTLTAAQTQQFAATLPNNNSVTWSILPVGLGSISTGGLYTAPACITVQQTVTVIATGATDTSKTISATVTLSSVNGYSFQRTLLVDHTQLENDETNFPLLVAGTYSFLATVPHGGKVQNSNGYDIVFTSDAAGTQVLNFEIENYNPATGEIEAWVNVPLLSAETDTPIYIFYGNSSVTTSAQNNAGVWDSNYQAVYHLGGGPTLSVADSTGNANNATANNMATTTGQIDGAALFNGTNSYLSIPPAAFGNYSSNFAVTLEGWFNTSMPSGFLVSQTDGTTPPANPASDGADPLIYLQGGLLNSNGPFEGAPNLNFDAQSFNSYSDGNWHYITYTYAVGSAPPSPDVRTRQAVLRQQAPAPGNTGILSMTIDGGTPFYFNNGPYVSTYGFSTANSFGYLLGAGYAFGAWGYLSGSMDEVRVSSIARTQDWFAAEYANQSNPGSFYSVSTENAVGVFVSPTSALLYGSQNQQLSALVTGTCSAGVTWVVKPTGAGTVTSSGLYTAPATVASQQTVTVTAVSQVSNTAMAVATITLEPPISVSILPQSVTLLAAPSQTEQFNAVVTNALDTSVVWSINPAIGSIDPYEGIYTPPSSLSATTNVTVVAASNADPTKTATATITLINGSSFSYQRAIVIDHTKVPNTDQTNFPVLISGTYSFLATSANGGKVQNPNGWDIIFTSDCNGGNLLPFEIEDYDPVTGRFSAWVGVPTVSHTTDTIIYLFYGNSNLASSPQNVSGVWDSNYLGVFHLGSNGGLSTLNSIVSPNFGEIDGTNNGATSMTGLIDGAAGFNGQSSVTIPNGMGSSPTVSIWFNTTTGQISAAARLIDSSLSEARNLPSQLALDGTHNNRLTLGASAIIEFFDGQPVYQASTVSSTVENLNDGKWHYAVGTYDQQSLKLYVDGQLNVSTPVGNYQLSTGSGTALGNTYSSTGNSFAYTGNLDEARMSSIVRSADWIATEYNNQSSPSTFYTLYPENTTTVNVGPSSVALYAVQTQQFSATVLGNCSTLPVTWSVGPNTAGTITTSGLYTAPNSVTTLQTVTITATSQATGVTGSVTLTLLPPASVSVTPGAVTLYSAETQQFDAAVANAVNTSVTWTLVPATGAGTLTATGLYTAPASIGSQQNATIVASSNAYPASSSATITLSPNSGTSTLGTGFSSILTLIAQALCLKPHAAPVVNTGATQFTTLGCPGSGPCSATVTLNATVTSYSLNPGDSLSYLWSLQSGPASVQFATPAAASTQASFTTAGTYVLQVAVNDGVATTLGTTTVIVNPTGNGSVSLYITPTAVGPAATGTATSLGVKYIAFSNGVVNLQNQTVQIAVTGANPQTVNLTTDANGSATFTYTGTNAGTDAVIATSGNVISNTVPVTWIAAPPALTSTPVTGRFFAADGTGIFNIAANQTPVFTQLFPDIDFNPAPNAVANNSSNVSNLTRPFTDVVTDASGNFAGTIQAQDNGIAAGAGSLYNFAAVFTGSISVPASGQYTFTFSSDSALIFGIGNGAARVSGPQAGTPATSPFQGYPVMGGSNQNSAVIQSAIIVNFPAPGFYVYEVDYAKGGDRNLTLTILSGGIPIPAATLLTLNPSVLPTAQQGQVQTLQVKATGSDGVAIPGMAVTVAVTGVNPQAQTFTTDGTGQANFAYEGAPAVTGRDQIQASAAVTGGTVYSNVVTADWNTGTNQAPVVSAGSDQAITLPAAAILNGSVTDDGLPNNTLTITWSTISGPGTVTFDDASQAVTAAHFSAAGTYVLQLSATDSALTTNSTVTITVNAGAGWFTGWIATPADGSTVTQPTPITLITGLTLTSGTLSIYPAANFNAVTVLNANTTGSGQIGTFDPSTLANGSYFVQLQATNSQGVTQNNLAMVHVTGNNKPGRVTATITDLTVPAPGLPIQISRTYDSLVSSVSDDFGFGWNLGINVQVNISPESDVTLTINGSAKTFYFTPPPNAIFTYYYTPLYTPEPGLYGSLITTGDNCDGVLVHVGQIWQCAINNGGSSYQPTGYQYTDPSGRVYTLGPSGAIQSVKDLNGNTLTVAASGISSSNGLSVPFVRDSSGRITTITDTLGNVYQYAYDTSGNLATVTYPGISTPAQYQYDSTHLLTKEVDQRGNTAGVSTYYASGQLQSVTDAVGNVTQYAYNTATNTTTVTNPDGGTVVTTYDSYGMALAVTDALNHTTTNTYDMYHDLITVTDPLNQTTAYTYDSNGFRTSTTDPLGDVSKTTNNVVGGPVTITDPLNQTQNVSYDSQFRPITVADSLGQLAAVTYDTYGNPTSLTDGDGAVSHLTYDANGDVTSTTDPLHRTAAATYDSMGRRLSMTDPRGNTTQYTYDALGRLTQTTNPDASTTSTQYDGNGNVVVRIDEEGRMTSYSYDAANRVVQATYPDSTSTSATYDWRGRVLTRTDQLGRVTTNVYDLDGELLSTTAATGTPDASTTHTAYDADGRKSSRTDPRGNVTTYSYDAASRLIEVTDALSENTTTAYDAAGRKTSVTDALGRKTQFSYDARNRLITTTYPDATTTQSTYDGSGRLLTSTDQAGKVTTNNYDASGQLTSDVDALNETTSYTYDPDGNRLTKTDADSHTTTYTYDVMNRLKTRLLPAGGPVASVTYNPTGTTATSTDFNGKTTTYSYDSMDRLLTIAPDASLSQAGISFTYTATGQRASMTDVTGATNYTFDNLDRAVSQAAPQGTLTYSYDTANNLLSLQSSNTNGASVGYAYDALNRLQSVTDNRLTSGQSTTTYSYDAVGNLITQAYPNGVQTASTVDVMNRVTNLAINNGPALAGYTYTYGPTGNKLSSTEATGRSQSFNYDAVYRLVQETISGDPASKNGSLGYSLDPVGNRLSLSSTVNGISSATESYNADDELTTDTYDANGNTLTSGGKTYSYDFENRLTSANGLAMVYDGDGNRVAKGSTQYLVSRINPTGLPQVIDEIVGGAVQTSYAYGWQRLSEDRVVSGAMVPSFYSYDGHEDVRLLTSVAGAVTDTYEYDSFGNLTTSTGSTPNEFLYQGEQFDSETGFYYLRARHYDAATGRFLNADPDMGPQDSPASARPYLYAGADPEDLGDPTGKAFESILPLGITTSVAASFVPAVSIRNNFVPNGAILGVVPYLFVCIMSEVGSELRVAADLTNYGDCVKNAAYSAGPGGPGPGPGNPGGPRKPGMPPAPPPPPGPSPCCLSCGIGCPGCPNPMPWKSFYKNSPNTPHLPPSPQIEALLTCMAQKLCTSLPVNSTDEPTEHHHPWDVHGQGNAVDIGFKGTAPQGQSIMCAAGACGASFAHDEQNFPYNGSSGHIHVELPDPGRNSPGAANYSNQIPNNSCCRR